MSSVPRENQLIDKQVNSPSEWLLSAYCLGINQAKGMQVGIREKSWYLCFCVEFCFLLASSTKMCVPAFSLLGLWRAIRDYESLSSTSRAHELILFMAPPDPLCAHCSLLRTNSWWDRHISSLEEWKRWSLKGRRFCPDLWRSQCSIWSWSL